MIAESEVIFLDDGRIGLVYKTPTTWKMTTIKADTSDHFVLEVPADFSLDDVATSPDLSALLFVGKPRGEKGLLVRCQHSTNTVETVEIEDNMKCPFLVRSNCAKDLFNLVV
jgi:hypothetical protein